MARKEAESAELEQQLIKAKREQLEHTQVCMYECMCVGRYVCMYVKLRAYILSGLNTRRVRIYNRYLIISKNIRLITLTCA